MATLRITEQELARDTLSILKKVENGTEVIIQRGTETVAVLRAPEPHRRSIADCMRLLSAESPATLDDQFAEDVEAAIASHREPLEPVHWD